MSVSSGALPRTNCNSRPVFKDLSEQVLYFLRHTLSSYAPRSYRHSWKLLLQIYQRVALTLPLSEYNVYNFICYLFGRAYSPSTIVSHISAISYIHKLDIQDPTTSFVIRKLLKGCNNLQPNRDCRLPITKDILIKILNSLNLCIPEHANRILLKAIFLLAFGAFLRLGQILIRSKAHSDKVLQVADVAINYEKGIPANINITL